MLGVNVSGMDSIRRSVLRCYTFVVLTSGLFAQNAPQPQTDTIVKFTDVWPIQRALEALKAKDQFETTAQYTERLESVRPASALVVRISDVQMQTEYDADIAVLNISLRTSNPPSLYFPIPSSGSNMFSRSDYLPLVIPANDNSKGQD